VPFVPATTGFWGAGAGTRRDGGGGADDGAGGPAAQDFAHHAGVVGPFEATASWPSCLKEAAPAAAPVAAAPAANSCFGSFPSLSSMGPWNGGVPLESRKRHEASGNSSPDDGVAALLPKMKRMRLKPSFGQLRLQREAEDTESLPPEIKLSVEPEQLRATVSIEIPGGASEHVYLELSSRLKDTCPFGGTMAPSYFWRGSQRGPGAPRWVSAIS